MGQESPVSLKALAFSVLAQSRSVPRGALAKGTLGTGAEPGPTGRRMSGPLPSCGSTDCAGCYEVEPGVQIHPPKCGEEYRKWLERWQPKGKLQ